MEQNKSLQYGVIGVLVVLAVLTAVLLSTSSINLPSSNMSSEGSVKKIPVTGAITSSSSSSLLSPAGLSSTDIADAIREADDDNSVDAILLDVNSPGGAPVASHEIVRAVDSVEKPIAAQIREAGASGAYWVASATDHITADPVSITGSVGVTASYLEYAGLLESYNVTYRDVSQGEYKELGSPFQELSDEEARILEEKIGRIGDYFFDDVAENRHLSRSERERVRTGVWFVGLEAKDVGLIDSLGGERRAISYLENTTNQSLSVEEAEFRQGFLAQLSSASLSTGSALFDRLLRAEKARSPRPKLR